MDNNSKNILKVGSSHLPSQKVTQSQRKENWKRSSVDYYINFRYTNGTLIRSDRNKKIENYELANGKIDINNIRSICDPTGDANATFSESFMHHDKISPIIHELLGEENLKPDTSLVFSESPDDITAKSSSLKDKIMESLKRTLMGGIDPSTVDPNNPPPTPQEILKAEKMTPSNILESKANKLLKYLKKRLNTKITLSLGFKDALIAGEEIYWIGELNGEPALRRANPLNMTVIMDDSDVFIDDAVAVIEERLLTIPSIMDEYGEELTKEDIDHLQAYSNGVFGTFNTSGGFTPIFNIIQGEKVLGGVTPSSSSTGSNSSNFSLRVTRVEWIGMKLVGTLKYTDIETGEQIEKLVDESFKSMFKDFKNKYEDAECEWFWINEAWEGIRIGTDIYLGIRPKPNQRRRMDNPYYCKLGYTGLIYEATNSKSVSVIDRLKSYQYLYDIISWKLQLVFASDMGKIMLMDLAQIPRSEGIDLEKWMYYLKENKIAFINQFEEGKKGVSQGKLSNFNQFQTLDMSLTNSVQQYINYLAFIEQQIYYVSGVSPQRLANIHQDEAVTNVQTGINQSQTVTQYLFEAHQEVKRRVYESLIEVAKICYRKGKVTQYINDDLTLEILKLEEFEFENSDFGVFVSNLDKDRNIKAKLDQLAQVAMEQQKADLSTIIDTVMNDSPREIINTLRQAEEQFYQRQQQQSQSEQDHQKQVQQMQAEHEQTLEAYQSSEKDKDRQLKQYEIDENNRTKIEISEISAFGFEKAPVEDIQASTENALKQQELQSKHFIENQKLSHEMDKHSKEMDLKHKELELKREELKNKKKDTDTKAKAEANKIRVQKQIEDKKAETAIKIAKIKPKTGKK